MAGKGIWVGLAVELPYSDIVRDILYDGSTVVVHIEVVWGGEDGDQGWEVEVR